MKRSLLPIFFLFLTALPGLCLAQASEAESQKIYKVVTTDGNTFTGSLISEDDESILLSTEAHGEISIQKSNIRSMDQLDPNRMRDGEYWFDSPQPTRYFFAPNAIGLKKGRGYYQNTWIFFNNANYGITDHFSLGGGTIPFFLLGASSSPVWLQPKLSLPLTDSNIHFSAGALIGGIVGSDSGVGSLLYGTSTIGDTDRNLTLGLGYGFADGELTSTPMVNLSGAIRTSESIYLITENYLFPGTDFAGIGSFGGRWVTEKFALDFALVRPLEGAGSLIGIPWLGFSIPFGK